ncbi:MAG: ABC transporter ATP-binding protein [Desulfitobacteriaceae bacterium]
MIPDVQKENTLMEVVELKKFFYLKGGGLFLGKSETVQAVNNVSFHLLEGETYGLVGESGSGKSTIGRAILRSIEPTSGKVFYRNRNIFALPRSELDKLRKEMQMVFQDPYSALNPRIRIGKAIQEFLDIHEVGDKGSRKEIVMDLLSKVGLQPEYYERFPREFSGGQRQRIVIARALSLKPKLIVCDEPVSALDLSIQSQIINLFKDLQKQFKLTYLFISHNLNVIRYVSDRVGVLYLGELVEEANVDDLFETPLHPYTQALISSIPRTKYDKTSDRIILEGDIPSPINPPSGCFFHPRCPQAKKICKEESPVKKVIKANHWVACHLY